MRIELLSLIARMLGLTVYIDGVRHGVLPIDGPRETKPADFS